LSTKDTNFTINSKTVALTNNSKLDGQLQRTKSLVILPPKPIEIRNKHQSFIQKMIKERIGTSLKEQPTVKKVSSGPEFSG